MSVRPATSGALERAFSRFEQAALTLEQRHSRLTAEVERLESQLLDAHRRLEAVLDALDAGVAVVSRDGGLVRTNSAFDRLGLIATGSVAGPPGLAEILRPGGGGGTARLRLSTPSGLRHLAANVILVGDRDGTRVLTVQDVTEIRQEEEEGGRRRRLEALGRMAAELAHELRNPLGSIRLFACMLEDDLADEPEQRAMAEQILAATAGLEGTVTNLLSFAAPPRAARRRLDLAALARDACSLLGPACSVRGVRLEGPAAQAPAVELEGDPEALRQVLLNLLGNALAATGDGGRIEVRVAAGATTATLEVVDDGRGIPSEDLPLVFDPFFSRTEGGTGLGLSIVHGIVERHGGRISLESRSGRGTRARVELPVAVEAAAAKEPAHA